MVSEKTGKDVCVPKLDLSKVMAEDDEANGKKRGSKPVKAVVPSKPKSVKSVHVDDEADSPVAPGKTRAVASIERHLQRQFTAEKKKETGFGTANRALVRDSPGEVKKVPTKAGGNLGVHVRCSCVAPCNLT
ncbi:hypothetical protein CYMTET_55447 [Cymbomonas tetramitiformis]|uniref:Uncharacterized protein n=1 Tax=Cymbomonas tetramitiformis TaxID=36881 RepID=A0AAE0EMT6_9CHLO|nr:hypothetical protein CYMTET_55447 [Cymbomonas tetramitiformis]